MIASLVALSLFLGGFVIGKMQNKCLAKIIVWFLPLTGVTHIYFSTSLVLPGIRMLVLISILFLGMKAVSIVYRYSAKSRLNFIQWSCFALGWPGMDAVPFEQLGRAKVKNRYIDSGIPFFVSGVALLCLLAYSLKHYEPPAYLLCLMSFIPLIMIFHFGLFNMLSSFWATFGVSVTPLMDAPWRALSLSEFWGKRWNIAFIQMIRITVFLPLSKRANASLALLTAFLLSGVFHEVALSLPVSAGFGLPLLYFMIQVMLIKIERLFIKRKNTVIQRVWTFSCLLLPFPLLFHASFVKEIFVPLLHLIL